MHASTKVLLGLLCCLQVCTVSGDACKNPNVIVASSQTHKGSGVMKIHSDAGRVGNRTVPPTDVTQKVQLFQSYDVDALNVVQKIVTEVKIPGQNGTISLEMDYILNLDAGIFTVHSTRRDCPSCLLLQGPCIQKTLPRAVRALRFLPLAKLEKAIAPRMYTCIGHEDGFDQLQTKFAFPPKFVPKSIPIPVTFDMEIDAKVDEKGVMHALKFHSNQKMATKDQEVSHMIDEDMVFTTSRVGGPSKEDLMIPDEWNCPKTSIQEPEFDDLMAEWTGPKSPFYGPARIIPHMLVSLKSSMAADVIV